MFKCFKIISFFFSSFLDLSELSIFPILNITLQLQKIIAFSSVVLWHRYQNFRSYTNLYWYFVGCLSYYSGHSFFCPYFCHTEPAGPAPTMVERKSNLSILDLNFWRLQDSGDTVDGYLPLVIQRLKFARNVMNCFGTFFCTVCC